MSAQSKSKAEIGDRDSAGVPTAATLPSNRQRRIGFGLITVIAAALLVWFGITYLFAGIRTVHYDNARGNNFKLKFYRQHHSSVSYLNDKTVDAAKIKQNNGGRVVSLASKVSLKGKYPVWLQISGEKTTAGTKPSSSCGAQSTYFSVRNDIVKQNIGVCDFPVGGVQPFYTANFSYKSYTYNVVITQVLPGKTPVKSDPKLGLEPYTEDLKTIIASIRPLQ